MKSMLFFEKIACFMQERIPVFGKQMGLIGVIAFSILMCGTKSEAATLYWPVPGHTSLSQGFHDGNAIDISDGSIAGANVVAAMGGKVTHIYLCGTQHLGQTSDCNGFGTGLVIAGDDGRIYQYAHMQANSIPGNVYYGAYVSAGQQIGKVGTTGNSSGNHLHFGISLGNYWNASGINPQNETYQGKTVHTHSYSSSVTTQPTCTATGVRTYRCSCGASYTESIPANGHSYNNQVVAPTITERGYTLHTCSVCGNSYKDNYVDVPELNSDGWYYCSTIPSGIISDKYIIEYNNYYEKIQATSPGTGWTNAATVKNEWQNSGGTYTSESDLPTSDSRVLVRSVYYHFCGPNAGAAGNYEQSGNFVHYDEIAATSVIPTYCGVDNGHPYYVLDWNDGGGRVWCKSGVTCDGAYGTHSTRCKAWYKMNTYQDRVQVVQYKFTKNSGWVTTKDASATSVKVRFKAIEEEPGEVTDPDDPGKEDPEEPGKDNPEEPDKEEISETADDYHFNVKLSEGRFYFTWDVIDSSAVYTVEYSIIPTTGFLAETMYEVVPTEEGKMCYSAPASPYNFNTPLYFRIKQQTANVVYSEVLEFNWPTHTVTFKDGNEVLSKQEVYEGASATVPSPVKDGYMLSWNGNYTNVTSDVTIYAVWTKTKEDIKEKSPDLSDGDDSTAQDTLDDDDFYEIPEPRKVTGLSVKNKRYKKLAITWTKQTNADGYQVQIATKNNFKKGKKTKIAYTNKLTWTGLKKGKTYYIRVRGYNYDDEGSKQYGAWSGVKRIKIRR